MHWMLISRGECIVQDCILNIQSILSRILAFLKYQNMHARRIRESFIQSMIIKSPGIIEKNEKVKVVIEPLP